MLPLPSQTYLKRRLRYDPTTGVAYWLNGKRKGYPAGTKDRHGLRITIDGVQYLLSRVIWKWMAGKEPTSLIDHADCNPLNNKWINLREADWFQNTSNSRQRVTWHGRATSNKLKGAYWNEKNKNWRAAIQAGKRLRQLGSFATEQEAHDAYVAASKKLHGAFHRS